MPMIMDDPQDQPSFDEGLDDMTDLFDDANSVMAAPLVSTSPYAPLRIDELAACGCRQKIAWSKSGAISQISSDGRRLALLHLLRRADHPHFSLSDPVQVDLPRARFQLPIAHTSWSLDGQNLTVFDSRGGLVVYQAVGALNRVQPRGLFSFDDNEASGAVVGLEWLRNSRPAAICHSVERDGDHWKYQTLPHKAPGISHPIPQRNAFITVSRNGTVRLYFAPALDPHWGFAATKVGVFDCAEQLLTHADFAPYKDNSLLLATYDLSGTLSIYEIKVDWQFPYDVAHQQQLPAGARLEPIVVATRLKVLHRFTIDHAEQQSSHQVDLTTLLLLPALAPPISSQAQAPNIVALFTVCDASTHAPFALRSHHTRIVTLSLSEDQDKLHSSLEQLASKKNKAVAEHASKTTTVTRLPDVDVQGLVLSAEPQRANMLLSLIKSDGTVEFRDRSDMRLISYDASADTFTCPQQAGWRFPSADGRLHYALSPNGVMMISRGVHDELKLHYVERPSSDDENTTKQDTLSLPGMAMVFANAAFHNHSTDDVFEIIRRNVDSYGVLPTLEQLYTAISLNPECVNDDSKSSKTQKLIMHPWLLRVVGFQQSLAIITGQYPVAGNVAKVIIDMKSVCTSIQSALFESPQHDIVNESNTPRSMFGIADYFITMCSYLIDSLLETQRVLQTTTTEATLASLQAHIATTRDPTVPLILCSTPRSFIRFASRILRTIIGLNPPWLSRSSAPVQLAWQTLAQTLRAAPVEIRRFEQLLEEINHHAKEAYEGAGMGDAERAAAEKRFLLSGQVPEVLLPVARRLLTASVTKMVDEAAISPMRLFGMDFARLGLRGEPDAESGAPPRRRDAVRKIDLSPKLKKAKRCTRCRCIMEDLMDAKSTCFWINRFGQTCICGNRWVVVDL